MTRPLTFNKQSNRDYNNSQQHNNYNRDYNSYRNYGNNSNTNSSYHPQQANNQLNHHHRAYPNNNNNSFNSSSTNSSNNSNHSHLNTGSTLSARPLEASLNKQPQFNAAPQSNQSINSNINTNLNSSSPAQIDCSDNNNDKSFAKWVPPSVTTRPEDQTQEDRNNIVFRKIRG